jgi:pyruvate dehydrogenase E1 component alpha subunit
MTFHSDFDCYGRMVLIRRFEEAVERLFSEGRITGTAHVCIGQEAIAVGMAAAMQPNDAFTSTHRGHGHFLAMGGDPGRMMAEMFGKATGYAYGRAGSQMMSDLSLGFYGANGITAGSMGLACGLALQAQYHNTGRVVVCTIGDGASNEGMFHESLNLAALWHLPLVVVCENNGYAMSTPLSVGLANQSMAARAAAYGITGTAVDGNSLSAVRDAVSLALTQARSGKGLQLVECHTYRLSGHSKGDKREYRSPAEEAAAWENEPLARLAAELEKQYPDAPGRIAQLNQQAAETIAAAIEFAVSSPDPDPSTVCDDLFAPHLPTA